jgi:SAM-dependent methyltransferase
MYWVDFSPYMIDMAARYLQMPQCAMRRKVIMFVLSDMLSFLRKQNQEMLDLVIMKYTLNFLPDIEPLIELVSQKLKPGGVMVATISTPDGVLKSRSTHARYVYRGHEFSPNEERHLEDGDEYGIKFFVNPNDPAEGYLAETTAFYHSCDKLKRAARRFGLGCFVGDWKEVVGDAKENKNVTVLVLKKRDE